MRRQHATPLLLRQDASPPERLAPLSLGGGTEQVSEATIRDLVHDHPRLLPIDEIDAVYADPVAICTELPIGAHAVDNFLVTSGGMPVLVECKLWRNAESRREVVGQILEYAKSLSRWTAADVQGAVRRRLGQTDDPVVALVRAANREIDDIAFNDALSANLRRGRFLLLIVGDGIREGVEAIAEYLQRHAGMHFSFGLV